MSSDVLFDLEFEAYSARAENIKLKSALELANRTTATALHRVEQLTAQRRTLARHSLVANHSKRLDRRDLLAFSREIHALALNLHDHQVAILRLAEERDHLRAEVIGEKAASLITMTGLRKDLDASRESAHKLALKLHRLRFSRRRVVA